jgi:hypothetical protein
VGQEYRTYTRDEADLYLHRTALICGCAPWRVNLSIPAMRAFQEARELVGLAPKW